MFTSNTAQYLSEKNENLSPLTNIDTLYYERAYKEDSSYIIKRQNMAKHMPVGYIVNSYMDMQSYNVVPYNNSIYQYEIADGDSYVKIIGKVSKYNASIYFNNGSAGRPADSPYTMYQVDIYGDVSLNECIGSYQTKYNTDISINDLSSYIYTVILSDNAKYDASLVELTNIVKNINGRVSSQQQAYNKIYTDYSELLSGLSVYNYVHTESIGNKNSDPFNSYIYTHEALWQMVSNNMLIPGNTYNMLYYPKYDVSIIENTYLIKNLIQKGGTYSISATIQARPHTQPVVDVTGNETYISIPAVMKLTAISSCQFSNNVMMTDFKSQLDVYFEMLNNNDLHIKQYITNQPYSQVFCYKNASNNIMSPIILDIITNDRNPEGIMVLYDHTYGYMFCLLNDLNAAFNKPLNNIYVFSPLLRYENNLSSSAGQLLRNIYNTIIFKTVNGVKDIKYSELPYKNFLDISRDITAMLIKVDNIEKINNPLSALAKTWTISNVNYNYYDTKNNYLYDVIDYAKWEIKYNFNDNRITYLKDEFGNESSYDFRNKIISYKDMNGNIFRGFTYNIAGLQRNVADISISILNVKNNAPNDALLYQSVLTVKNNDDIYIYDNKFDYGIMFMTKGSTQLSNNTAKNVKNVIVFDSVWCNINGDNNVFVFDGKNVNSNYNSNLVNYYNKWTNLKNINITTTLNVTYPNTFNMYLSNINGHYIYNSSMLNIYNCNTAGLDIDNCNMINMQNHSVTNNIQLYQLHNITLHTNTYNLIMQHLQQQLQSDIFVFDGSIYTNSSTLY